MTNTKELKLEMLKHNDNGGSLSSYLGITHPTFSHKLNNKKGSCFTQNEICLIMSKYNLSSERVCDIFFG